MVSQHWPSPVIPLAKPTERPGPALGTSPGRALVDKDFIGTFRGLTSGFPALAQHWEPALDPWFTVLEQGWTRDDALLGKAP